MVLVGEEAGDGALDSSVNETANYVFDEILSSAKCTTIEVIALVMR